MDYVSNLLGIRRKSHNSIAFLDVPVNTDVEFFIDPTLIERLPYDWCKSAQAKIDDFFQNLRQAARVDDNERLRYLLSCGQEINALRLGYSQNKPCGRGASPQSLFDIFVQAKSIEILKLDLATRLQDHVIFIENFDKDRLSDLLSHIILSDIASFTYKQCKKYKYDTSEEVILGKGWDAIKHSWMNIKGYPIWYGESKILLLPKFIICKNMVVSVHNYIWKQILKEIQDDSFTKYPDLCRKVQDKRGRSKFKEPRKKDLYDHFIRKQGMSEKDFATSYTMKHKDSLEKFGAKHITDKEIDKTILSDADLDEIVFGNVRHKH